MWKRNSGGGHLMLAAMFQCAGSIGGAEPKEKRSNNAAPELLYWLILMVSSAFDRAYCVMISYFSRRCHPRWERWDAGAIRDGVLQFGRRDAGETRILTFYPPSQLRPNIYFIVRNTTYSKSNSRISNLKSLSYPHP